MLIRTARFISSHADYRKGPDDGRPEYAFIGRSNVGKSSLINLLTGRRSLALTSSTPGKTQTINHFLVNDTLYLVDLPGYGYARTPIARRSRWQRSSWAYLKNRETLVTLFVLVDASVPPQARDITFVNDLGNEGIPFAVVFTKSDKCRAAGLDRNVAAFKKAMGETWATLPPFFVTSSVKKKGKEKILDYITATLPEG